nr:hypothetical protein [Nocardia abscessus]
MGGGGGGGGGGGEAQSFLDDLASVGEPWQISHQWLSIADDGVDLGSQSLLDLGMTSE